MTAEQVTEASREITRRCVEVIDWEGVRSLHSYVPMRRRKEVSSWWWLKYVWERRPKVITAVPVVRDGRIESVRVDATTRWQENAIGIPEPQNGLVLDRTQLFDVIIVPVLGFDRQGNRLGYGRGHYDRFLRGQSDALTIGLAYAAAEVTPNIPAEPHDVPLHYIVTERAVINAQTRRQTS
jgi:5-formyltetrahydrofolate cyclo-ligase